MRPVVEGGETWSPFPECLWWVIYRSRSRLQKENENELTIWPVFTNISGTNILIANPLESWSDLCFSMIRQMLRLHWHFLRLNSSQNRSSYLQQFDASICSVIRSQFKSILIPHNVESLCSSYFSSCKSLSRWNVTWSSITIENANNTFIIDNNLWLIFIVTNWFGMFQNHQQFIFPIKLKSLVDHVFHHGSHCHQFIWIKVTIDTNWIICISRIITSINFDSIQC
jgi:hypothetical protein